MLTRLEAHGFKNLLGLEVDLGPYNCLAGPNGVGKSNLFDAIRFLSLLAERPLLEAALAVRGTSPESSDPLELFWSDGEQRADELRLAAEMLVEPEVVDDFGRSARVGSTHLRYEIRLGYEPPRRNGHLGRLVLRFESLTAVDPDTRRLRFPHNPEHFLPATSGSAGATYLSTRSTPGGPAEIRLHADGEARGDTLVEAASAPRTLLASASTLTTPTLFAVRREMSRWRVLALEPSALRGPDSFHADPYLGSDGRHLPATLYRLATEADSGDPPAAERLYARLAVRLAGLVPIRGVRVDVDEGRRLLTLEVREAGGVTLPARALSDGTLRFLALSILHEDPSLHGLLCLEEPENGIHPSRIPILVELLRDLSVDARQVPGRDNPLRQVLVATHSPAFVRLQEPDELLLAMTARTRGPSGRPAVTLRCRALANTWRTGESSERGVGKATLLAYLSSPSEARIHLPEISEGALSPR